MWPGTGAIVAALEYATERTASSVGKPEPQIFETALDRLGPASTLVVGDRSRLRPGGGGRGGARRGDRPHRRQHAASRPKRQPIPRPVAIAEDLQRPYAGDVKLSLIVNPSAGGGPDGAGARTESS